MHLSKQRYLISALSYLGIFLGACLVGVCLGCIGEDPRPMLALGISALIAGVTFLPIGVFHLFCFFALPRRAERQERRIGTISNWSLGFFRHTGSVSLRIGDEEYSSPAFFGCETARELVGRRVSFCTMDTELYLFALLDVSDQESTTGES